MVEQSTPSRTSFFDASASRYGPAIAAAILSLALFAITLNGTYVRDDQLIAQSDPRLHNPALWGQYWTKGYALGGIDHLYRPLVSMSYAIEWWLHGDRVWIFHAVNWLMHAAVAAMMAEFTRRWAGTTCAYLAGLLFAAHPSHVEAVAGIVGRADLACALFFMSALIICSHRPLAPRRAALTFACFLASLLSKESGILLPLILLLFLWCSREIIRPRERPALRGLAIALLWTSAGYMFWHEHILKFEWDRSFWDWTLQPMIRSTGIHRWVMPIVLLGHYVQLFLFPLTLSPDYGAHVIGWMARPSDPYLWLGIATAIAWLFAFMWSLRQRAGFIAFCLLAMALTYGIVSNVPFLVSNVAERLMYLPSAFAIILISLALSRLPKMPRIAILTILLGLACVRSFTYARDWNTPLLLYRHALADKPDSSELYILYASELTAIHEDAAAKSVIDEGLLRLPDCWSLWNAAGEEAMDHGRFDEADAYLQRGFALHVGVWHTIARLAAMRAATQAAANKELNEKK